VQRSSEEVEMLEELKEKLQDLKRRISLLGGRL